MEESFNNTKIKTPNLVWGPASAIIISLLAYFTSQLVLIIPLIVVGALSSGKSVESIIDGSPWMSLAFGGVAAATMLLVLWLFLKKRRNTFRDLSFKKITKNDVGWMLIGLFAYFALLFLALFVANLFPGFNADQTQDVGYQAARGWQLLIAFAGLVILPPFAEEMLFRGFLYRGMASKWPKIVSALIASTLFAVVHFQWNVGIDVFVLSIVMIFLLEKTKNLWVCIALHMIKNFIAFMAIFVFVSH